MLGELQGVMGRVRVCGSLAYVPQQPWIMSGTLRDNILFKRPVCNAQPALSLATSCKYLTRGHFDAVSLGIRANT